MVDSERYTSMWEGGQHTVVEFDKQIEASRRPFQRPLQAAYSHLYHDVLGTDPILVLGIGTGQVEELAQVDSARITGVDVSPYFLVAAQRRLPKAVLYSGRIQDTLSKIGNFPQAVATDALDCINPKELTEVLSHIHTNTGKLVIAQLFTPDDEFYAPFWATQGFGSHGGPGIEGWSQAQLERVTQRLSEKGVVLDTQTPKALIDQLQKYAFADVGMKSDRKITDALERLFPNFQSQIHQDFFAGRPYPSRILLLLKALENQIGNL